MKMCSRDDETLPLSGFSGGFSADVTVDEDFIPTSQPQSSLSSKTTKIIESNLLELSEANTQPLSGFVDDTLPAEALLQETQEKSLDFIPDTVTKRRKIYSSNTVACRKKLPVFGTEKFFDTFWEKDKVLENSTLKLQTNFVFCDSPVKMESSSLKTGDGSASGLLVNDSADTVELGDTPLKEEKLRNLEKLETCESFSLDRCEDTQMFDNSVLMLDQAGPSGLNKVDSQKLYLNETVEDELQLQSKNNLENSMDLEQVLEVRNQNKNFTKEEPSTSQEGDEDSPSVIVKRKIDFKLNVSCLLIINAATKKVIQKAIINVDEKTKPKTPLFHSDLPIDCGSDKSKRCSTSSSGSVYSDQNGLPFALPKRKSGVLDQTCASDSSDENVAKYFKFDRRNLERVPWNNEWLLTLKMDEILKGMIDNQDLINRPNIQSPKKPKRSVRQSDLNRLEHISENSFSGQTSKSETDRSEKVLEGESSDAAKCSTPTSLPEEIKLQEETVESIQNESNDVVENVVPEINEEKQVSPEPKKLQEADVSLCDGLRVFARWTDKQYYSGVLSGQSKNDKWDVLFDDGKLKAIKEDFIMPAAWLKVGSLVFALVGDSYESGQVTDVKKGGNTTYVVQLDNGKQELTTGLSDMSLSDDMASILRENYRPLVAESPQRKADITCDNVLSGKRLREYRTPLRRPPSTRMESSESKKKLPSKAKDLESLKETPKKKKSDRKGGLKSESGRLIGDKTLDSPSGNEVSETPFRNTAKEVRSKAKPRSLTYEPEEKQKKKQRNLLNVDITAIPGPSGVKFRKKKVDEPASANLELESSMEKADRKSPQHEEKNKRKRKAAETGKEESPKKPVTDVEIRMTRGKRK